MCDSAGAGISAGFKPVSARAAAALALLGTLAGCVVVPASPAPRPHYHGHAYYYYPAYPALYYR